jgi:hypothetical protein
LFANGGDNTPRFVADVAKLYTTDTLKQAGYGLHNEEKKTMETRAIEEDEEGDIIFP